MIEAKCSICNNILKTGDLCYVDLPPKCITGVLIKGQCREEKLDFVICEKCRSDFFKMITRSVYGKKGIEAFRSRNPEFVNFLTGDL